MRYMVKGGIGVIAIGLALLYAGVALAGIPLQLFSAGLLVIAGVTTIAVGLSIFMD